MQPDSAQAAQFMPLQEVLQDIVRTNPEILEALKRYQTVRSELGMAKSGYKPNISAEASIGPEVTKGYDTNYESEDLIARRAGIYARQNLFNGLHTSSYVKETEARVKAAAYDVLNTANRVFLEAAEAYLEVLKSAELVELARQNVLTQAQILKQIKEKTDSGFGRASDLSNSESRFALARSNFISQQQDLNQAIVKFHRQFGRILRPEVFVIPEPEGALPITKEEAVDMALHVHPALRVANYNIEVRKHTLAKDKSAYWPSLDLELQAEHSNDVGGDDGWTNNAGAFLKLSYTFYDGGIRKARKTGNYESMLKEYQRSYIERRNVNETVGLAWNIFTAEQTKKLFLTEHVDMSEKTLVEFKEEYHLGRRTLLELLDIETEYFTAQNSFVQSKYSFLAAYYRLAQSTGMLLSEFETGLFEKVELKNYKDEFDYALYRKLGEDRDKDTVKDTGDQCDNSLMGVDTLPWGCFDKKGLEVGYNVPEKIEPYILPKEERVAVKEQKVLAIDESKKEQSFHLDIINFNFDSAELTPDAREYLKTIAGQIKGLDGYKLEIVGHTDISGTRRYNQKLSERRAETVVSELAGMGVNKGIMTSYGKGSSMPLVSNQTLEGRQKNRRIEFKLIRN
ncbi:MAG: TolC family outer membrane protein [Deferribacterales bacterium]